jgi:hypothetical protein
MRTGRAIIVSIALTLGLAGSLLAGPAMSVAAVHAPSVHVQAPSASARPNVYLHA